MSCWKKFLALIFFYCGSTPDALSLIEVSNPFPKQGETIELRLFNEAGGPSDQGKVKKELAFLGQASELFPYSTTDGSRSWRALVAIPADLKPGRYALSVGEEKAEITVGDGGFPVQRLKLAREKDNFIMSPGEKEAVEGAKKTVSSERLWQGKFYPPSKARRSAGFGLKRIVNGRLLKDYYHSGLDFAANLGSPVDACAAGKVLLARTGFKLHGNVIAIDHGQGVISFYIHLQKLLVKEGSQVSSGEQIATVGQSGRATGPHLHFSIYVNQTASNPAYWFAKAF
jgi:murein DD-endopeptidase MepM/ murein hydrolase activator NlpD